MHYIYTQVVRWWALHKGQTTTKAFTWALINVRTHGHVCRTRLLHFGKWVQSSHCMHTCLQRLWVAFTMAPWQLANAQQAGSHLHVGWWLLHVARWWASRLQVNKCCIAKGEKAAALSAKVGAGLLHTQKSSTR